MKFKVFSTLVDIPFLVVSVMSAVLIVDKSGNFALCFMCALIHECGHLFAMFCFKERPQCIRLRLFDFVIVSNTDREVATDMIITLSGPVFNLLSAFFFYFVSRRFSVFNLVFGVFNLLPLLTFDGGHALMLFLYKKFRVKTTETIIKVLTFIFLIPAFCIGVLVLFYSKYNYSLLLISLYLLAVLFLK